MLPSELTKVLQNVDDTIAKLERKILVKPTLKRKSTDANYEPTQMEKLVVSEWNNVVKGKW